MSSSVCSPLTGPHTEQLRRLYRCPLGEIKLTSWYWTTLRFPTSPRQLTHASCRSSTEKSESGCVWDTRSDLSSPVNDAFGFSQNIVWSEAIPPWFSTTEDDQQFNLWHILFVSEAYFDKNSGCSGEREWGNPRLSTINAGHYAPSTCVECAGWFLGIWTPKFAFVCQSVDSGIF